MKIFALNGRNPQMVKSRVMVRLPRGASEGGAWVRNGRPTLPRRPEVPSKPEPLSVQAQVWGNERNTGQVR